jgi:hypothetical protein
MKSFFENLFKTKSKKLNENLEQLMASGNFVKASEIIDAAKYRIDFSDIVKRFSETFDEELAAGDKIPAPDKLGVFITFMKNGLVITPRMIPYIVANAQYAWQVFDTFDLALRQGKKLENLIGEKGLGGTTLLELSTWNRSDRSMFFKIDVTTYLAEKGAVMTVAALNNILKETQKDLPAKKDSQWGREDVSTEGWKLPQVEKVFKALMQDPKELTSMLQGCKALITNKFGEDGFKSLLAAATSSRIEGKPSANPQNTHFTGDNGTSFSQSQANNGNNGAMLY